MVNLAKLVFHSAYPAFKNNSITTGTGTISGTTAAGTNTKTFTVTLDTEPDLLDVVFNGPSDTFFSVDPRPSDGWFRQGQVWVRGDSAPTYVNYGTNWAMTYEVSGSTVTIKAIYTQTFTNALTLTATDFSYRIIDYSVF